MEEHYWANPILAVSAPEPGMWAFGPVGPVYAEEHVLDTGWGHLDGIDITGASPPPSNYVIRRVVLGPTGVAPLATRAMGGAFPSGTKASHAS